MGAIILLIYGVYTIYALSFKGKKAVEYLIYICFFQNILIIVFSSYLNNTEYTIIALVKEAYVAGYFILRVLLRKKTDKETFINIGIILFLIALMFVNGQGAMAGQLRSFRQLYLPFLFFVFGKHCNLSKDEIIDVSRTFVKCSIFACCFGIIEMLMGIKLWTSLGIARYISLKGLVTAELRYGVPNSFYTYDIPGMVVRRMASILVDPVILGQLLGLALILSLFMENIYTRKKYKILCTLIIGVGLCMTLAKGGLVIAALSICVLLGQVTRHKVLSNFLMLFCVVFMGGFFAYVVVNGTSGVNHFNGLIAGFRSLISYPLGRGIGAGGNMAASYGGISENLGGESYIGSLLVQLGWIGVVINLYLWKRFFRIRRGNEARINFINIFNVVNITLLLTSFVNYTAISFTSCFMYIILGSCCGQLAKVNAVFLKN